MRRGRAVIYGGGAGGGARGSDSLAFARVLEDEARQERTDVLRVVGEQSAEEVLCRECCDRRE